MQILEQIAALREKASLSSSLVIQQQQLAKALQLAIKEDLQDESLELYFEAAALDHKDPLICYLASVAFKVKGQNACFKALIEKLEEHASSDAVYQWHILFLNAALNSADKACDPKYRELVKSDSAVIDWQAYRCIDQNKWRNIVPLFVEKIGGDQNQARNQANKEIALLAEKLELDDTQQADFWKQVYQTNKDDIDAQRALIRLYQSLNKAKEYVEVYRKYIDSSLEEYQSEEKIEGLKAIIAVYESGELQSEAILTELYAQLLKLDPENQEVSNQLIDKYGKQRKWKEVIDIIDQNMSYASEISAKIPLLLKSADIYLNQLKKTNEAKDIYSDILEIDPSAETALLALSDIAEKERNYGDWAGFKQRLADLKTTEEEKIEAYKENAIYADKKLRSPAIAQQFWQGILDLGLEDVQAYAALLPVAEQNKDWDQYCEYAKKFAALSTDQKDKIDILSKSALIQQEKLNQNQEAKALWLEVLKLDSEHKKAQDALKKVLIADRDWDALSDLISSQGKWDELVKLLEAQINQSTIDSEKVELSVRVSRIYIDQLKQIDKATKLLEKAKELEDQNKEIAELLAPIYEASQQTVKLAAVLEIIEQYEEDQQKKFQKLSQLIDIYEKNKLYQKAFEKAQQLLVIDGASVFAWDSAIRLNQQINEWQALSDILEQAYQVAENTASNEQLCDFSLKIAQIYREHLQQNLPAIEKYELALSFTPARLDIIQLLEKAYQDEQDWDQLLRNLDAQREWIFAHEQEAQALSFSIEDILLKEALVFENQLQRNREAIDCYARILEKNHTDINSLDSLQRLYQKEENYEGLYTTIQQKIALLQDQVAQRTQVLELNVILADLEISQLDKIPEAILKLKAVIAEDEGNAQARAILEALLNDATYCIDAAQILMSLYEKEERFEEFVSCLEMTFTESLDEAQRIAYLQKIAFVQEEKLNQPQLAFDAYARLLKEQPENRSVVQSLLKFVDALELWSEFCALIESSLLELTSHDILEERLLLLAQSYETKLNDPHKSIDAYQRVISSDPVHLPALIELQRLYTEQNDPALLIEILKQRAGVPGENKAGLLTQAAEIYQSSLGENRLAIQMYQQVLEAVDQKESTLQHLADLFEAEEEWNQLTLILEQLKQSPLYSASEIELKLGAIYEHKLFDFDQALVYYFHVLDIEFAKEESTILSQVISVLEGMLVHEHLKLSIAQKLQPVYEKNHHAIQQLLVYEIQATENTDLTIRLAFLHKMADLLLELGETEQAFRAHLNAFVQNPVDPVSVNALNALVDQVMLHGDLITAYEQVIDQISIPVIELERRICLAELYLKHENQSDLSADQYQKALKIDPRNDAIIRALEGIYQANGQWHDLIDILNHKVSYVTQLNAQKDIYFRISQIYSDGLNDVESALSIYEKIGNLDPTDVTSMSYQERILIEQGRWADVVDVLKRKELITKELESKKEIYYLIGAIYEDERLNDTDSAIETYLKVLAWDENDWVALSRLEQIYQHIENWDGLKQIFEKQLSIVESAEEAVGIRYQLAQLYRHQYSDPASAFDQYQEILNVFANHAETLAGLEDMIIQKDFEAEEDQQKAIDCLTNALQSTGSFEPLVTALSNILTITEDQQKKALIWVQIAQIRQEVLFNDAGAYEALVEALKEVPTMEEAYQGLEKLVEQQYQNSQDINEYVNFVRSLQEVQAVAQSDDDQVICALRLARLYQKLSAPEESIEQYLIVKGINPIHEETLVALEELYEQTIQYQALADVLQDRISLLVDHAELLDDSLDEHEALDSSVLDASMLDDGLEEQGEADVNATSHASDEQKIALLLKLANVFENGLSLVSDTIETYAKILKIEAQHPVVIEQLRRLFDLHQDQQKSIAELIRGIYIDQKDWASVLYIDEALCAQELQGEEKNIAMKAIAQLALERLENKALALSWYGTALKELPEDEESRLNAVQLATELQAYPELLNIYDEARKVTTDIERRIELSRDMAVLYRDQLHRAELAEQEFKYILELDFNDYLALSALDDLYVAQSRPEELIDVLIRKINISTSNDEYLSQAQELMLRLGALYEEYDLNQKAIEQYNDLLVIDSENMTALKRLEVLYEKTADYESLYENYQRQLDLDDGSSKVKLQKKMAYICANFLNQHTTAIELYESVYQAEPENLEMIQALGQLYAQDGAWRELVNLYEKELILVSGQMVREIEIYSALGTIWHDHLENLDKALHSWNEVLYRNANEINAHFAKKKIFEETYAQDELLAQNLTLIGLLGDQDERKQQLYRQIGKLYFDDQKIEESIQAWKHLLELNATDLEALEYLEQIYTQAENWTELAQVLSAKVAVIPAEEQIELLQRLGQIYEETLNQLPLATQIYQGILERDPFNQNAFDRLEALFAKQALYSEQIDLLLNRLEKTEDIESKQEIYQRTAAVFEDKLSSPENALLVLINAFTEMPNDESLGDQFDKLGAASPDQWENLVITYENAIIAIGVQAPQSIPLHLRVAKWYDQVFNRAQEASAHYEAVLRIEAKNLDALKALENLFERYSSWEQMAMALEQIVAASYDPDERKNAWLKLAKTRETRLNQTDAAIKAYLEVIDIQPDHLDSLKALELLYNLSQNWRELVAILEKENQVLEDSQSKVENLLRIAELRELRLNDTAGAIQAYYDAIDVDAMCADAMLELERIYRQQQKWEEIKTIYEMLLTSRTKTEEQIQTYQKLGKLQLEQLKDEYSAIASYRKVLSLQPNSQESMTILDQLYRKYEQWEDLKNIYDRYLEVTPTINEQIPIRLVLSQLAQAVDNDYYKAIDYLTPIVESQDHLETLQALGALYANTEQWTACIEQLTKEISLLNDRNSKLERYYHIAMIYSKHLSNQAKAQEWLISLLDSDPTNLAALVALKEVYEQMGDWLDMIKVLQKIEAITIDFKEKSACFYQIGTIYSNRLSDNTMGMEFYQKAIDFDPSNTDVAPYLIEFYIREEKWIKAEPLLELLVAKDNGEDPNRLKMLHYQLALCAQKLRKEHKALENYQHAYRLDSTHYPTLQGLAELYLKQENWDACANILQNIMIHYSDKLSPPEKVQVYLQQGIAKKMLNDLRRAEDLFKRAIEIDPTNALVLNELIEVLESREKWEDALYYRKLRLEQQSSPEEKFEELFVMAEKFEAQGKVTEAIQTYQEALQINEHSRRIFSKLLPLFEGREDWLSTVNLIEHFAQHEADPETKAKFFFAIGAIQRDQIKDSTAAVRSFDKALDAHPQLLKAFQSIEEILAKEKNFERQDRYFRKMLKRANDYQMGDDMIWELAKALAEINRSRLKRYDEAIKAYLIALNKKPNDLSIRESIAELYESTQKWDDAAKEYKEIIKQDLRKIEAFHRLFSVYVNQNKYDEAWCVAQAINALAPDHVRAEEADLFNKHYQKSLIEIRKNIEKEHWGLLIHSSKSHLLDQLFERLYAYNAPAMERDYAEFGVNKKKHLIPDTEPILLNKVTDYISKLLKFERPQSFMAPAGVNGLRVMNLQKPAVLVGNDILKGSNIQVLTFNLTKQLYLMTPHALMSTIDLEYDARRNRLLMIVYSLMKLANLNVPAFDQNLCNIYNRLNDLDRSSVGTLIGEMQRLQGKHIDISQWLQGLDHTGNRLGFLVCNDLNASMAAIRNELAPLSRLSVSEKIQSLILFSISDEYFALRKHLGFAIR